MNHFRQDPKLLSERRKRCLPMVDIFNNCNFVQILSCNVCDSREFSIISDTDRYGLSIRCAICHKCGLIFLLDRFSDSDYGDFYQSGDYRTLLSKFYNKAYSADDIDRGQIQYAKKLVSALSGLLPEKLKSNNQFLDIGGSTGLISQSLSEAFGFSPVVIEPSSYEADIASTKGLTVINSSFELWETSQKFSLVLLCRTFEHLLDPMFFLGKVHSLLEEGGLFFCDISDFLEICYLDGPPNAVSKIDHCYWLTQETAGRIFSASGFEVLNVFLNLPDNQVGFLLRKTNKKIFIPIDYAEVATIRRKFQDIEKNWLSYRLKRNYYLILRKTIHIYKKKVLEFCQDVHKKHYIHEVFCL